MVKLSHAAICSVDGRNGLHLLDTLAQPEGCLSPYPPGPGYPLSCPLPSLSLGPCSSVCFITAGPITKLCAWGEEESGGHVLCETTSRVVSCACRVFNFEVCVECVCVLLG